LFPVWDVALIGTFATMNFLYGTYLHAGFDPPWMPSPHSRYLVSGWHHNEHHAGSLEHNYGFFTGVRDIWFNTRFTPNDKVARRPRYRCTECRDDGPVLPAASAWDGAQPVRAAALRVSGAAPPPA
jgi:sterol desaturase/sphingolipid hydroxylase (fatty acid hydroxylase superfamily)